MSGMEKTRSDVTARPRWRAWLWMLASVVGVIAAGTAIRLLGVPQASAQAPATRPGTPAAQPRQPAAGPAIRPAAPGGISATAARPMAQPAAVSGGAPASTRPDPSTLQVMAVVNTEQITRTELGRECIRRYGEEVLESMVNRQLIADACAKQGIQDHRGRRLGRNRQDRQPLWPLARPLAGAAPRRAGIQRGPVSPEVRVADAGPAPDRRRRDRSHRRRRAEKGV